MERTHDSLLKRIQAGDATAFAEFANANRDRLRAYIDRNLSTALRQKVDAEDLLQETILSCLKSLPSLDSSQLEPFGWLCQVAQRRIADAGRKYVGSQKRDVRREVSVNRAKPGEDQQAGIVNLLVASITSPSRAFSRDQREFRLLAALDELPAEQKQALQLRYVDGLPTKEIADRMGKTDGALRVMLTRSIKKLEKLYEDQPVE